MSAPDLAALLQTLESFPADMPLDEVLAKIRPPAAGCGGGDQAVRACPLA